MLQPLGLRLSAAKTRIVHLCDGFDFLGFHIRWKRKRGTNQWYVYTFITPRPIRSVEAKVRSLTHRVSQANMGAVITRINQILRGWTNYFRHAVCKHTLNQLRYFVNCRLIRWLCKRHRWRQFRRRFTTPSGSWLPFGAGGVLLINPASVRSPVTAIGVRRFLTRTCSGISEQLTVESRVRREAHARFGERPGETDRQQCRHCAPGRLNHLIAHRAVPLPLGSRDRVTSQRREFPLW